mmetsp:Transcript_15632/g.38996  ORF Transcript_15632/g.38996 Transcript_15632/m.38996 type:complete len:118 (+) Transcript_15632:1050-1403(+)
MASPHVAGALAVLASNNHPTAGNMVDGMYMELKNNGNANWMDRDNIKEPLLDMTNLVDASMVGCGPTPPSPPPTQFPTSAPVVATCGAAVGESCGGNSECCSNKCRGKPGSKKCKSA